MFKVTLATPTKVLLDGAEASEVTLPGQMGELNILPGHSNLVTVLTSGLVTVQGSELFTCSVSWGYCEVDGDQITVLAEMASRKDELNLASIRTEREELERKMVSESASAEGTGFDQYFKRLEELSAQEKLLEAEKAVRH